MSSDWNKPGGPWQEPPNANWTQSPDLIPQQHVVDEYPLYPQQEEYASVSDNVLDASFLPEDDVFPDNQETDEREESTLAAGHDPTAVPDSLFKQLWQYVTLIVFPLLFFGIACLFTLPAIATQHASLPKESFWFVAIVLLIIAIGQGVAIYFSAPHHNMWILGTAGGFILFLLLSVFVIAGPLPATLLLLAILGGCIYLAKRCINSVLEGSVDIVFVSGKYKRTLYAGLNLIWPWENVAHHVNIEEIHWYCEPQKIQLSPEEDVTLRAVISYQVVPEDAYLAVTQIKNWEESLRNLFETTLQTIGTHFAPTDFLAWPQSLQTYQAQIAYRDSESAHLPEEGVDDFSGDPARREHINMLLFQQMRDRVALWGVQIHWVRIRDIELKPHRLADISNQAEKELVIASSVAQPNGVQLTDALGKASTGVLAQHKEPIGIVQTDALPTPSQPLRPKKLPTDEILRKAYEEVQNGKVTDPQTIRQLATTFEAVAKDPEACQKVSFDAERAAANLYEQAERNAEMHQSGIIHSDVTKPDFPAK